MIKVIFMGTPDYAEQILDALILDEKIDVVAVYTQPDKEVGRKKILTPSVVKQKALQHSIDLYQPYRLRDDNVVSELLQIECDFIVVAAYGQILPKKILEYVPCINLHASILPQYRGASPIQQTLLNGDKTTGVTAMLMDEGLDTGDIIKIETIDVKDDELVESLFDRLAIVASDLTLDVLKNFATYKPFKQDETKATNCKKIVKSDGLVEFDDAMQIYNRYRAFHFWPEIFLQSGLKLKQIGLADADTRHEKAGTILAVEKDHIVVSCLRGALKIYKVQPKSKKMMDVLSYINGKRLKVEDTLF